MPKDINVDVVANEIVQMRGRFGQDAAAKKLGSLGSENAEQVVARLRKWGYADVAEQLWNAHFPWLPYE